MHERKKIKMRTFNYYTNNRKKKKIRKKRKNDAQREGKEKT